MEKGSAPPAPSEIQQLPPPYSDPGHPVGVYQAQPQAHVHYAGTELVMMLNVTQTADVHRNETLPGSQGSLENWQLSQL